MEEISIVREPSDWLPVVMPGTEGVSIKVYKVDEKNHRAVLKIKFEAGAMMPKHLHHCYATALTVSGSWTYDEGSFSAGDIAYENLENEHTPTSEEGAELFIVFDSPSGQYVDNYMPDGSVLHLGERWLKALEGISLEEYEQLDLMSLVDIFPEKRKVA